MKIKKAPRAASGEAISLEALKGKAVALVPYARKTVDTKFGKRTVTAVRLYVLGSKEPLDGVLFQSYFHDLALNEPVAGVIEEQETKLGNRWILNADSLTAKQLAQLETALTAESEEPPF